MDEKGMWLRDCSQISSKSYGLLWGLPDGFGFDILLNAVSK